MSDFSGRSGGALVTGGSGGIGAAISVMLAQRGSPVAFTYRSNAETAEQVAATVRAAGVDAHIGNPPLEDADAMRAFAGEAAERLGGLHTVVSAAGPHVPQMYLSQTGPALFAQQIEADVIGAFNLTTAVLPHLRPSGGSIVYVTTAATTVFPKRDALSSIPKGAVESLMRAVAVDIAEAACFLASDAANYISGQKLDIDGAFTI